MTRDHDQHDAMESAVFRGVEPAEHANVLVVEVHVHETPQPGVIDQ